jgi:hypothetical protein
MALVNRLSFRGQSQQARPSAGRLHHPNTLTQFLHQHVPFRRSTPSPGQPPVVNVAAGHAAEVRWISVPLSSLLMSTLQRVIVISVPHYKKVNDTRRPPTGEGPVLHDTTQSDTTSVISYADSLPNVHWFMAFLCYLSCWSNGRLRMPPRWDLEPAQSSHQNNGGESRDRS